MAVDGIGKDWNGRSEDYSEGNERTVVETEMSVRQLLGRHELFVGGED